MSEMGLCILSNYMRPCFLVECKKNDEEKGLGGRQNEMINRIFDSIAY